MMRTWNGGSAGGTTRCVSRTPLSFWGVWHSLSGTRKPLMGKKEWNYWLLHCRKIIVAGHHLMNPGFCGIFYSGPERWRHLFLRLSSVIKHRLSINGTQAYEFIHGKYKTVMNSFAQLLSPKYWPEEDWDHQSSHARALTLPWKRSLVKQKTALRFCFDLTLSNEVP